LRKNSTIAKPLFTYSENMKIGYARISTADQSLDLQTDALKAAGCERIFQDVASGAKDERRGLTDAIEFARAGDVLTVWKLDRLGRSLKHLIETVNLLHERGIGFTSLQENIDTTTSGGKLIFYVFGGLAEFERDLIRERTHAGLKAARARGRTGGRKQKLTPKQIEMAKAMVSDPNISINSICETLKISKPTLYRYVPAVTKKRKEQEQSSLL
jgi:DNA invertase Pin-like site-specific DNA recombinase